MLMDAVSFFFASLWFRVNYVNNYGLPWHFAQTFIFPKGWILLALMIPWLLLVAPPYRDIWGIFVWNAPFRIIFIVNQLHCCCVLVFGTREAKQTCSSAKWSQVITLHRQHGFSIIVFSWSLKHFRWACWKWSGIPLLWELSVNLGPFPKFKFGL